jgi:hypothetical protein
VGSNGFVAQALEAVEKEGMSGTFRQFVQRAAQTLACLIDHRQFVGSRCGIIELRPQLEERFSPPGFADRAPPPVDDQVSRDREEIAGDLVGIAPAGPMLQQPKIGLLHDVLGIPRKVNEAADEAPKRLPL